MAEPFVVGQIDEEVCGRTDHHQHVYDILVETVESRIRI